MNSIKTACLILLQTEIWPVSVLLVLYYVEHISDVLLYVLQLQMDELELWTMDNWSDLVYNTTSEIEWKHRDSN